MEREQFTFYASFARAIGRIRKASDRCAAYDAICAYALSGLLPDMDSLPDSAAIAFEIARPILDASKRKAENGKLGGSKPKQTESKPKQSVSKPKQTESKTEEEPSKDNEEANPKQGESPSKNKDKYKNKNKNKCYIPPLTPPTEFDSPVLASAFADWLSYKDERREPYKPTGYRSLVTQISNAAQQFGDEAVAELIRNSIASGYRGIIFDRLKKHGGSRYDWMDTVVLE